MKKPLDLRGSVSTATTLLFFAFLIAGRAATITWTNTSGGNWSAATNWSPQQVPQSGDDVVFAISGTLTVDVAAQANSLTMSGGGTLAGPGPLTLAGPLNWSGGIISTVAYFNGGTVDDPGGLDGGQLINSGTLMWIPYPDTGADSVISNTSTGTLNLLFSNGRPITANSYGGSSHFYNAGQINVSGSGTSTIGDTFINTGSITVSNGTLEFAEGGTNFGTIAVQSSGGIGVAGGNFYFTDSSVLSGSGGFVASGGTADVNGAMNISGGWTVSGGTADFSGTSTATGQTLTISGAANFPGLGPWKPGAINVTGTLAGPSPIVASGPLNWNGGTIKAVVYFNGGTVDDPSGLNGGQLINSGTLTWIPYPYTGAGSVISNASTGTLNLVLNNGRPITANSFGGSSYFYNAGQLNASGSGTSAIGDTFINTGSVTVSNGGLEFADGGTNFGAIVADGPATVGVAGGSFYFADSSVLSGAGGFVVNGGTANVGGALDISGSWAVGAGTANFNSTSSAAGQTLTISGGVASFVGAGPWIPGSVNLSSGIFAGTAPVIASGPLDWTGGMINGILSCNGGTVDDPSGLNGGQLINTGPLNWIPYPYTGSGSVISNAATGTINLPLNGRPITANDYGGTSTFYNSGQINASGPGSATIGDTFINNGTLNLQSGTLDVSVGAVLDANSSLNVTVSNRTSYGTLGISGPVSLAGAVTLGFTGYTPHTGDSFTPITFGSASGIFSALDLPSQVDWQVVYAPTEVSFNVTGVASPFITLLALPQEVDTNGFELMLIGPIGSNYTVQASSNLESWAFLTNFTTTYSSFIIDDVTWTNLENRYYRAYISP